MVINVFLNTRDALDKIDARSNESIFVGYSTRSKIFKIFNKKTFTIEEPLQVKFDESLSKSSIDISSHDDDIIDTSSINNTITSYVNTNISNKDETPTELPKAFVEVRNHPHDLFIGDISQGVQTQSKFN